MKENNSFRKDQEAQEKQTVNAVVILSTFTEVSGSASETRFLTLVDKESEKYQNMKEQTETKATKYVVEN